MCECYQIGGRFIAEDPDCPEHGRDAQSADQERSDLVQRMMVLQEHGTPHEMSEGFTEMLRYLQR